MQREIKELNALPVRTWRWLGVNGGPVEFDVPEIQSYAGRPLSADVPAGAEIRTIAGEDDNPAEGENDLPLNPEIGALMASDRNAGYRIRVASGQKIEEPIVLDYRLDQENQAVLDDNLVLAGEGSSVTVVMHYASDVGSPGLHCGRTRLIAQKNARIKLVQIQTLAGGGRNLDNVSALALEGAHIEVVQAELGGRNTFANCHTRLRGAKSGFDMNLLYFGDHDRAIDLNVVAEHYGKKTRSEIAARGALLDSSDKIFRGTIDFKKGSAGSVGREDEKTMLFSPRVHYRTAPLILCAEEDVDGRHSASAGRANENQLFYLMSRGLSSLEAKKLLIEAEFQPVLAKIPVPAYREEISDFLKERLKNVEQI